MGNAVCKCRKRVHKSMLHNGHLSPDEDQKNTGFDHAEKQQAGHFWTQTMDGKAIFEVVHQQCNVKLLCCKRSDGIRDGRRDDFLDKESDAVFNEKRDDLDEGSDAVFNVKRDDPDERSDDFLDGGSDAFLDEGHNDFLAGRKDTFLAKWRGSFVDERRDDFPDGKTDKCFGERLNVCLDKRSSFLSETLSEHIFDRRDSLHYQSSKTVCERGSGHFFDERRTDLREMRNVISWENKVSFSHIGVGEI